MLTIGRDCSYRIITRAVQHADRPLVGLLDPGAADCAYSLDADQLTTGLAANLQAIIVYNQHPDALALIERLELTEGRLMIEIRQDTKGVLGLQALRRTAAGVETLELVYQE
jgi:hypothetical protein